jgi:cell division protein FtsW
MAEKATTGFFNALEETKWDLWLAAATIGLVVFGLVMVYSASGYIAEQRFKAPSHYFLLRQLIWVALGLGAMYVTMRVDYLHYWKPEVVYGLLGASIVLLGLVFFFPPRNGAHRWITFGSWFSAQPSELAKLALIIFLARFLAVREQARELDDLKMTLLPASAVAGILALLIIREPDLGTALMLGIIFIAMMFASGVKIWPLFAFAVPAAAIAGFFLIWLSPWRWKRILIFLNPESDPQGAGYQVYQSLITVGSGGLSGLGLGEGKQKLSFLPEPHSDFIFAVIGEELGFVGAVTVVLVFGFLLWRGLMVSRRAPDRFGQLLALGLTMMLIAQAFFNISVVLSLAPNKGIPLPFVSAGGSSLLFAMAAIGLLLNISEKGRKA